MTARFAPVPPAGVRPSRVAKDASLRQGAGPFARPGSTVPGPRADYDVVVVGAGPAGTESARRLAALGHTVLILEEHDTIGEPVQCAGLIAKNVFPLIGLDPHGSFHQQDVRGAHIVSPNGKRLHITAPEVHAYAVSRAGFDRALAERAAAAGAETVRGATFVDNKVATGADGCVRTLSVLVRETPDHDPVQSTVTTRLLIGADGIGSEVARTSGFPNPQFILSGLEVELDGCHIPDPEYVRVHTGTRVAPGYFAWVVPKGKDGARVGLCLDIHRARGRSAWDCYQEYLKVPEVAQLTQGARESFRIVGCIPLGLSNRLVGDGVALVGDAAGMAKPTSGGGIYMACWGAKHLAETVGPALAAGRTDAASLGPYDRAVRRTIGRELRVGAALHRVFRRLTDADLDRLTADMDHPRVLAAVEKHGDIDHPSKLLLPLLARRPRLLRYAGPAVKALLSPAPRLDDGHR